MNLIRKSDILPGMMQTYDLHYHVNFGRRSGSRAAAYMRRHRDFLTAAKIDGVASTEHIFKDSLKAYRRLADALQDTAVTVIPGVEWLSREGVDIVFLFPGEAALVDALKLLAPYSHTIWDLPKIRSDIGGLAILPHPFSPGRSGAAVVLGEAAYFRLVEFVDYVEIHNGRSLLFSRRLVDRFASPKKIRQIRYTFDLPSRYRPPGVGWSVGSDAHYPGSAWMVGAVEAEERGYALLEKRVRFAPVPLAPALSFPHPRRLRDLAISYGEHRLKTRLKRGLMRVGKW